MYYVKSLTEPAETLPIKFEEYWRQLEFRELITYAKRQEQFRQWEQSSPGSISDIAAAVFTQIHHRKGLPDLVTDALEYCKSMLYEQGYKSTDSHTLAVEGSESPNRSHVVLVVGCQGPELLRSRARAAYELLRNLRILQFKIVFSGANPAAKGEGRRVRIPDEARDLQSSFRSYTDADPSFKTQYQTYIENSSVETEDNVRNFLAGGFLRPDWPATLYVVSSTFHLPRLAKLCESNIADKDVVKEVVERIVVIPAEDSAEQHPVVQKTPYVKWMMYEVYKHLLCNSPRHFWAENATSKQEGSI